MCTFLYSDISSLALGFTFQSSSSRRSLWNKWGSLMFSKWKINLSTYFAYILKIRFEWTPLFTPIEQHLLKILTRFKKLKMWTIATALSLLWKSPCLYWDGLVFIMGMPIPVWRCLSFDHTQPEYCSSWLFMIITGYHFFPFVACWSYLL